MRKTVKSMTAALASAFALTLVSASSFAASPFEGVWKSADTSGTEFEITLSADGKATGARGEEGLSGMWKDVDGTAVITWTSGWTTKISKEGSAYKKSGYAPGQALDGPATNSSAAEKVK
jgi:hypothetical protein